jgi:hypothetical protein
MFLLGTIFQWFTGKRRYWCVNCQMECIGKRRMNHTDVSYCVRCDTMRPVEVTVGI